MLQLFVPLGLALSGMTNAFPAPREALQGQRTDSAAVAALIEAVQEANNAGNVDKWVSLFDDDFVYMAPGSPAVTTRAQLVDVARTGFRNRAAIDISPIEIRVIGDMAYARNAVSGTVTLAGSGREVQVDVKQLVIYRKSADGRWRISRFSSNSNTQ